MIIYTDNLKLLIVSNTLNNLVLEVFFMLKYTLKQIYIFVFDYSQHIHTDTKIQREFPRETLALAAVVAYSPHSGS